MAGGFGGGEATGFGVAEERVLAQVDLPRLGAGDRRHVVRVGPVEVALQVEEARRVQHGADHDLTTRLFCGGAHPGRR